MADLSRRELLIGAAGVGAVVAIGRQPSAGGAVITSAAACDQALRPVLGGT